MGKYPGGEFSVENVRDLFAENVPGRIIFSRGK